MEDPRFVTHNFPPGHVDPPVHLSCSGITLAGFFFYWNPVAHNAMTTAVVQHDLLNFIKLSDIHDGKLSILFTSPEAILDRGRPWWDSVLISQRERICLIAVDEAHCMLAWWAISKWCVIGNKTLKYLNICYLYSTDSITCGNKGGVLRKLNARNKKITKVGRIWAVMKEHIKPQASIRRLWVEFFPRSCIDSISFFTATPFCES